MTHESLGHRITERNGVMGNELPWKGKPHSGGTYWMVTNKKGLVVADVFTEDDCARIVTAVNNHDEMVGLIGKLIREFRFDLQPERGKFKWICGSCGNSLPENKPEKHGPDCLIAEARALLKRIQEQADGQ